MTQDRLDTVGEYVLGLMDAAEQTAFEAEMARDEKLRGRMNDFRDHMLALDLSVPAEPLPGDLTDRIRRAVLEDTPPPIPTPFAANLPHAPIRWKTAAAIFLTAGLSLGAGLGVGRTLSTQDPQVVAVLLDAQGVPQAVVEGFGNDTAEVRFVAPVDVPEGHVMQVWTLPSAERGPVSLGLLADAAAGRLQGPELPPPADQQLYEITLEPQGGSPTGRPTGPILGKGLAALQRS
ncbi:anti-sigma factor domain-containing protein [Falsirhodobacter sp. alg1]|uniref:anti-sigma factor n=2 Tax=Falsirhodobacter sp. alg1 TaxID=1472418 RepID=UPI0005EDD959|nr:anti-sigma factor [Falsirhodobacter sp. alg1]